MEDCIFLSAEEMAERVRRKEISPVELLDAHLARLERLNPQLNAFVSVDADRARQHAQAAEAAQMREADVGPLHGVPITIKSSIDVAGLPCEVGTKLRAGFVAKMDAPLVTRLRAAGAIILGTTNVPEMLVAYETDNLLHGRTNNPWDLGRTPGGSSGGEAAAIAAGFSAAGVGSDGGGSIRVPAHFSGICGLKPTPGRIPATGHFPPCQGPFALLGVVGPMARTVPDLALLLRVMAGPESADANSAPVAYRRADPGRMHQLRIGYFEDDEIAGTTAETRVAVRAAASALEKEGFVVEPFRPKGLERMSELWWVFFGQTAGLVLGPMLAGHELELSPILKDFIESVGADAPLTRDLLLNAWMQRDQCRAHLLQQMERFPILLCPVSSAPAFRHAAGTWRLNGRGSAYRDVMRYSQWFNLTGNPAVVVPVGKSPEGLPIGVQVVGRPWEEETVLAVAAEIERACGGWQRPPI